MHYRDYQAYIKAMERAGFTHILYMRYYLPLSDDVIMGRCLDVVPASEGINKMRTTLDALLRGVEVVQQQDARVDVALDNNDIGFYVSAKCDDETFHGILNVLFDSAGMAWGIYAGNKQSKAIAESVLNQFGRTMNWNRASNRPRIKPFDGFVFELAR